MTDVISFDAVAGELNVVRKRTFGELPENDLATRAPTLATAARQVYGEPPDRPAPLRRLLSAATNLVTPTHLRPAIADLFGLGATAGRTLSYRQEMAAGRFDPPCAEHVPPVPAVLPRADRPARGSRGGHSRRRDPRQAAGTRHARPH
jgi:hypothetical protein